jgi:hypothetical protein
MMAPDGGFSIVSRVEWLASREIRKSIEADGHHFVGAPKGSCRVALILCDDARAGAVLESGEAEVDVGVARPCQLAMWQGEEGADC